MIKNNINELLILLINVGRIYITNNTTNTTTQILDQKDNGKIKTDSNLKAKKKKKTDRDWAKDQSTSFTLKRGQH